MIQKGDKVQSTGLHKRLKWNYKGTQNQNLRKVYELYVSSMLKYMIKDQVYLDA